MQFLDLTLPTPEENLALDEAMLLSAEADGCAEYLRVWESPQYFVVLGKNCHIDDDVRVENCVADRVPILRRVSGGGTVLLGPGCLNFSLILRLGRDRRLAGVVESFEFILDRMAAALRPIAPTACCAGTSDLMIGDRKFSGNCQRRQRTHLLHHGTILNEFDMVKVERFLREPRRQPDHRRQRDHASFLTNLHTDRPRLVNSLQRSWDITGRTDDWPRQVVSKLVQEKYAERAWVWRNQTLPPDGMSKKVSVSSIARTQPVSDTAAC